MADVDSVLFHVASFITGLFLLEYGADKFIDHTAIVAKRLNVSPTLVGLLTCGAEWEELVVIAVALGQKNQSMALGNLMGSSIANILASFSLGLLFMRTATFDRSSKIYAAALLGLTSLFLLLLYTLSSTLKWAAGILLVVAFIVYVVSVASAIYKGVMTAPEDDSDSDSEAETGSHGGSDSDSDSDIDIDYDSRNHRHDAGYSNEEVANKHDDEEKGKRRNEEHSRLSSSSMLDAEHGREMELLGSSRTRERRAGTSAGTASRRPRPKPLRSHILKLLLGLGALMLSSYVVAYSAGSIGSALGLSGTVIGTTILSLATTLPEKFVSIMGGMRHQPGIMVANTVGSNIFLVTLCGGVLFLWGDAQELKLSVSVLEASMMLASAVIILGIVLKGGKRWMGGVMLGAYVAFLVAEVVGGRGWTSDD